MFLVKQTNVLLMAQEQLRLLDITSHMEYASCSPSQKQCIEHKFSDFSANEHGHTTNPLEEHVDLLQCNDYVPVTRVHWKILFFI